MLLHQVRYVFHQPGEAAAVVGVALQDDGAEVLVQLFHFFYVHIVQPVDGVHERQVAPEGETAGAVHQSVLVWPGYPEAVTPVGGADAGVAAGRGLVDCNHDVLLLMG